MNQCRHTQNEKGKKWHSRFTRWFFFRFNFLFCFCFVRFFSMGEYARWLETARRWLNQCSIIDPLSLSLSTSHRLFQISPNVLMFVHVFSGCWSYECSSDRTKWNGMCAAPIRSEHSHEIYYLIVIFAIAIRMCSAHRLPLLLWFTICARCLSFTRFLLHEERAYNKIHQNPPFTLHFCAVLLFSSVQSPYSARTPCAINFTWFEKQNAKTTKK